MSFLKKTLPFFSYVFHPIFISIYGLFVYLLVSPNVFYTPINQVYITVIQVLILTLLLPISLYFLLVSIGIVSSFTEATLKERRIPITIQALLLFVLIKWSLVLNDLPELYYFYLGGFLSSLIVLISVLLKFKASLHMIGISSLVTFMYSLCLFHDLPIVNSLAFTIVCAGAVASSRLYMKSHTPIELIVGMLIGIIPQVSLWYFWTL